MLDAVEAVLFEQFGKALLGAALGFQPGQQALEQRFHHAGQFGPRAAGGAELVQFRPLRLGQRLGIGAKPAGDMQRIVAARQQRPFAAQQVAQVPRSLMAKS